MTQRIDSQMMQIHQRCKQGASDGGQQISEKEAMQLIRRAHEINETHSSSYSSDSRRGNKYLLRLMDQNKTDFSPESEKLIQRYIRTGRVPASGAPSTTPGGGVPHHGGGGSAAPGFGGGPIPPAGPPHGGGPIGGVTPVVGGSSPISGGGPSTPMPGAGGGRVPGHPSDPVGSAGARPGGSAGRPMPAPPSAPSAGGAPAAPNRPSTPTAPATGGTVGATGPNGTVILDFVAPKATWGCHWFPIQETRPGGDPTNNLFAVNGPLDKLDAVTGNNAREQEFNNPQTRKSSDAGREYGWWGHCNNASEAACVLPQPKHAVEMKAADGSIVKFTVNDIQGLLVKCTPLLVDKVDFKGNRFNTPQRDDPNDPSPRLFLDVMMQWSKDGLPFVFDIDRGEQVWNFPYDKCKISESSTPPQNASGVPAGAKYYHVEASGTGYPEKKRVYEFWIGADGAGEWVKTPNTHNNPDFMWRPHTIGDVMNKATWTMRGLPKNSGIDPAVVYDIYMKSLA